MGKNILTLKQKQILTFLSRDRVFQKNFYLSGGTALAAYYLHHRFSEDLDFFCQEEPDLIWLNDLKEKMKKASRAQSAELKQSFNRNLLFLNFPKETLKTEFTYYPFKQIESAQTIDGIKVDSLRDIAVNKFFTIYQKPSARHFIDLYLMVKEKGLVWEDLIKLARIKFDEPIDPLQLGSQLVTAETISDLPRMILDLNQNEWRRFFMEKAKNLKKELI